MVVLVFFVKFERVVAVLLDTCPGAAIAVAAIAVAPRAVDATEVSSSSRILLLVDFLLEGLFLL